MQEEPKKLIQSAAIRVGIGLAAIFIACFLGEQEVYQKACYMLGYFFAAYNLILEGITAMVQKKLQCWEQFVSLSVIVVSLVCVAKEYYVAGILLMVGDVLLDSFMKWRRL